MNVSQISMQLDIRHLLWQKLRPNSLSFMTPQTVNLCSDSSQSQRDCLCIVITTEHVCVLKMIRLSIKASYLYDWVLKPVIYLSILKMILSAGKVMFVGSSVKKKRRKKERSQMHRVNRTLHASFQLILCVIHETNYAQHVCLVSGFA